MSKNPKVRFVGRFLIYFFFVAILLGTSILTNLFGPSRNQYTDETWKGKKLTPPNWNASTYNVVFNQHTHTIESDGRLTYRQTIEWHIAMGYNAVVITDHNKVPDPEELTALQLEYVGKIVIIPGMEWTTSRLHMNFLGILNWTEPVPSFPSDDQINATIKKVHDLGGLVTFNHIPWSVNQTHQQNVPTREQMRDWRIDFIEIVNDESAPLYVYDAPSIAFCETNKIGQITGTDMHDPDNLRGGGVHGWTYMNASAITVEGIMNELRARRTHVEYSPAPYKIVMDYPVNPSYMMFAPLIEFGLIFVNLFESGLNIVMVGVYLGYIVGLFIMIELYAYIQPRFWIWWNQRKESRNKPEK